MREVRAVCERGVREQGGRERKEQGKERMRRAKDEKSV
jgi:hypothetical protein